MKKVTYVKMGGAEESQKDMKIWKKAHLKKIGGAQKFQKTMIFENLDI